MVRDSARFVEPVVEQNVTTSRGSSRSVVVSRFGAGWPRTEERARSRCRHSSVLQWSILHTELAGNATHVSDEVNFGSVGRDHADDRRCRELEQLATFVELETVEVRQKSLDRGISRVAAIDPVMGLLGS